MADPSRAPESQAGPGFAKRQMDHEITFLADELQLAQLQYALVDRVHELERLLAEGDCDAGYLQSSLEDTRAPAIALNVQVGQGAGHDVRSNSSRLIS
jgi:hypothetical protein